MTEKNNYKAKIMQVSQPRKGPQEDKRVPCLERGHSCSQTAFDIAEGFVLITFNKTQSKDDCLGSLSNKVLSLITILYYG